MTGLLPLLLLWAWNRGTTPQRSLPSTQPFWPTAASPPPPVSAFQAQPPPMPAPPPQATADTATPLAELHAAPPTPPPPTTAAPQPKIKPKKSGPAAAAKKPAASAARKAISVPSLSTMLTSSPTKNAPVLDLQKRLNARGAKLKADGLYGPKTATAWQTFAKSKGLPPTISRVGPKIAKVATQTYDALSVPAIP